MISSGTPCSAWRQTDGGTIWIRGHVRTGIETEERTEASKARIETADCDPSLIARIGLGVLFDLISVTKLALKTPSSNGSCPPTLDRHNWSQKVLQAMELHRQPSARYDLLGGKKYELDEDSEGFRGKGPTRGKC